MSFPLLTSIVLLPVVGAVVVALIPRNRDETLRAIGLIATIGTAVLAVFLTINFKTGDGGFQFVTSHVWIRQFGVSWKLGGNCASRAPSLCAFAIGSRPSLNRETSASVTRESSESASGEASGKSPSAAFWYIFGCVNCWCSFSENSKVDGVRSTHARLTSGRGGP
jgi:hypothetical protein